ncbi:hypothetical protein LSH36_1010g00074, partial [Paralvinella palmiformis]
MVDCYRDKMVNCECKPSIQTTCRVNLHIYGAAHLKRGRKGWHVTTVQRREPNYSGKSSVACQGDEGYEISGIQELNETIFSDTTVSSTDVSSSIRPSAAQPSPVPGRPVPLLASTPTIDLHQPVERIERKILYDEIDNLRREKKDLVVERDILLASRLNSCVIQNDD